MKNYFFFLLFAVACALETNDFLSGFPNEFTQAEYHRARVRKTIYEAVEAGKPGLHIKDGSGDIVRNIFESELSQRFTLVSCQDHYGWGATLFGSQVCWKIKDKDV